jgi:hypothetical protein
MDLMEIFNNRNIRFVFLEAEAANFILRVFCVGAVAPRSAPRSPARYHFFVPAIIHHIIKETMIPNLVAPPSTSAVFVVPATGSSPSRLPFSHAAPSDNGRLFRRRRHPRPAEWINRLAPSRGEGGSTDRADGTVVVVVERRDDDDIGRGGFNASLFASLNCWGCRPLLVRGAYDAEYLLGQRRDESSSSSFASWPTWEEVVDIASDVDSDSR